MVENVCTASGLDDKAICDIRMLLWGTSIKLDVYERWSQGFEFSDVEPSALVQRQGGPCAVIAPVQAFLLKILLMETPGHSFNDLTYDKCKSLLIHATCNILMKCAEKPYRIVLSRKPDSVDSNIKDDINNLVEIGATDNIVEHGENNDFDNAMIPRNMLTKAYADQSSSSSFNNALWTPDEFHERLTILNLENIEDVEKYYSEHFYTLTEQFGVLLFLYTVLLTKGIENVASELSDTSEPLIHSVYGYGSQALINLMLTGRAVAHVWDNDQDVGGLKLLGINQQSDIGFITLMEQMRYCTVGSFYKNPKNPVWVMGSETHLSVLFSNEKRLVSPETSSEIARRVFKSYDPDGNNFIPSVVLQDVLCSLDLVSEPEYVDIMRKKLDPESLGIILLNGFMDEFFPDEKHSMPDTFDLLHYNGIPGSNDGNKVKYNKGVAILLECNLKQMCNMSNPMLTCLQTKWPNIEVNWLNIRTPSLN